MKKSLQDAKPRPWWLKWLRSIIDTSVINREELIHELRQAQKNTIIGAEALSMIEGVMQVDNLQARDIMIPRSNIHFIHYDDSFHDILKVVMQAGHSRYPVFDENRDDVEGILLAKDLLKYIDNEKTFDIEVVEKQISGRTMRLQLDYRQILNAEPF